MECAVCKNPMRWIHEEEFNGMLAESIEICDDCGYEEHFAYGARKVVIGGVDYPCGDSTTIEGNLQAWRVWFAIIAAREALGNAGSN